MASSSLTQGLALLAAAVEQERSARPGVTASRLAEYTGIERSRVSRLSRELSERRLLERDGDALFTAGAEFFRTAAALNVSWLRESRVALRSLASALGMNAFITVAEGVRGVVLRHETAAEGPDRSLRDGLVTPIWCTGAGRALLWDHGRADIETLLHDVQFVGVGGPTAPRSADEVERVQERDRAAGLISAREEYDQGVDEFALPIRHGGAVIASIAVRGRHTAKGPSRRTRMLLEQFSQQLSDIAERG
ncbi:IclR family transcriptional regulator C-terminal domain-containing protein [Microbacterium sp. ZW T6_19]|uniref:IclR family transcriptional regulator domain-containing protein n=1 Tax=Microbacterium sp. ZW T6_19 TaxID=3378082 RepID=UPI003854FA33